MIRFLKAASLVAALATLPIAATAQAETVRIPVADLNLQTTHDARFEARLNLAAKRMCESYADLSTNAACQKAVKEEARENLAAQLSRSNGPTLAMAAARR
jgi:UrcA family protein